MSPLDPEIPPAGEEVHLPGPSILPLVMAVGITLTVIGITTYLELTAVGIVIMVLCALRWIRDTRRDIEELPLDEH
ncbi:MAG TPA: hypothetical protein VGF95_01805 [Solirubrobacteraceae bacterium]|jgi:hypothetical protein